MPQRKLLPEDRPLIIRKYPRFEVHLPVSFSFCTGSRQGEGTIYNLSLGGCRIESDTKIERNECLRLRVYVSIIDPPVIVESAVVRWSNSNDCGIEFLVTHKEHLDRLQQFLRMLGAS